MTTSTIRNYLVIMLFVIAFMGVLQSSALGFQMTIDAIEDAGQFPGQGAYLGFAFSSGFHNVPDTEPQWTSSSQVYSYASSHSIPGPWQVESAGNIWSSDKDKIVGDALTGLNEGIYRVSVGSGAFMYDAFDEGWSPFENQWRWELHIQALRALKEGQVVDYYDYLLGSMAPYSSEEEALQVNFGQYIDIPLADGGSLIFWIYDNPNTIDNSGSLTFNVVLIPEPSTFILAGTGLLFLSRYFRKLVRSH